MWSQFDSRCWLNLTLNVESIWLSMLSQFDSQCWVNLTLNVGSIWLSMLIQFDSQCWFNLTHNIESIWLSMSSQFDSQCWVNLTQAFFSYSIYRVEFQFRKWLNFSARISVQPVTQLFMSKWLNFISQCIACRYDYSELDDAELQAINQDFSFSIIDVHDQKCMKTDQWFRWKNIWIDLSTNHISGENFRSGDK